jgi:hypothetical protein
MFMKSKRARLGLLSLVSVVALATCFRTTGPGAAQDAGQKSPAKKDAPDEAKIRALIAQLGDDSFDKREAAQKSLTAIGLPAYELVRRAATEAADLEVRERASRLVTELNQLRFQPKVKDKLWGSSIDPDGDCRFLVDQSKLHIMIPNKPHRLAFEQGLGAMNAPRVLQEIEGDFSAEVQIPLPPPYRAVGKPGEFLWFGAGLVVWQDDENYLRLERARDSFPDRNPFTYANWELRSRGKQARKNAGRNIIFTESQSVFLKLQRKGDVFSAASSLDGSNWKELPPFIAELSKKLLVGVSATHNTLTPLQMAFDRFKIISQ